MNLPLKIMWKTSIFPQKIKVDFIPPQVFVENNAFNQRLSLVKTSSVSVMVDNVIPNEFIDVSSGRVVGEYFSKLTNWMKMIVRKPMIDCDTEFSTGGFVEATRAALI